MNKIAAPIAFAGSQLCQARHVCAFFNSNDEAYRVLLPFIKDGFECGDKAVHVVNPDQHQGHQQRLTSAGIDPVEAQQARVNEVWDRHDDAVICVYDLAKFGGDTVVDMMRTHPMIIVGGILQANPFFVPPDQFLRELRERRAGQATSPPSIV